MSIQDQLPDTELAKALKGSEFLEKHFKHIVIGIIGALVAFGLAIFITKSSQGDNQEAWGRFESAVTPEQFDSIAEDYPGTAVSAWSKLMSGEQLLGESVRLMYTDRKAANTQLKDAESRFDDLIDAKHTGALNEVAGRAFLGKARVLELWSGDNVTRAVEMYKTLLEPRYKGLGYEEIVQDRIDALGKSSTQQFYAWFDKQNPNPNDRPDPFDGGLPPGHPSLTPISLPPIPPELYPAEWSDLKIEAEVPNFEAPKKIDAPKGTDEPKASDDATKPVGDPTKPDASAAPAVDDAKKPETPKSDTPAPDAK